MYQNQIKLPHYNRWRDHSLSAIQRPEEACRVNDVSKKWGVSVCSTFHRRMNTCSIMGLKQQCVSLYRSTNTPNIESMRVNQKNKHFISLIVFNHNDLLLQSSYTETIYFCHTVWLLRRIRTVVGSWSQKSVLRDGEIGVLSLSLHQGPCILDHRMEREDDWGREISRLGRGL